MSDIQAQHLTPRLTADGSYTFFSHEFNECFHSYHGAKQEARGKFVIPTGLPERARQECLTILDICYGLGYNSAAALECIWQVNPDCRVTLVALEVDVGVSEVAIANNYLQHWSPKVQTDLAQLCTEQQINTPTLKAQLFIGDARQTIQPLAQGNFTADAIFLDPFSPPHCPQLWTVDFLTQIRHCLHPNGRLATYSCSAAVRAGLMASGFQIGSSAPVGRRTPGTVAALSTDLTLPSLSLQEAEHMQTRAAVPYRDPTLQDCASAILQRRRQAQQCSALEPTRQWKNRWLAV
jgi:tRNA U34 5-methylaminomethyl-2-thiouridine-forming methyltransferase MnmC